MAGLQLRPELFLYLYMASCISVLVFNIAYIFIDKYQQKLLNKKSQSLMTIIQQEITSFKKVGNVSDQHLKMMSSKLRKLRHLKSFEGSMKEIMKQEEEILCEKYIQSLRCVFIQLISTYEKRDKIEKAYFAHLIELFKIDQGQQYMDPLIEFLIELSVDKDVFVRENALRAIFSIGNKESVLSVWKKMDEHNINHNMKLLSDGLLRYSGDKEDLIKSLLKRRKYLDVSLFLPILQFIRFYCGDYQEVFMNLLMDNDEDKEIRLEAIRYFRKYPFALIRDYLQEYVWYHEYIDWEYATVTAQALSSYPGEDTVRCLKYGLRAANWYIRLNCAESLIVGLKVSQVDLYDIYNGQDRYAREILHYVTDKIDMKRHKMELNHGLI